MHTYARKHVHVQTQAKTHERTHSCSCYARTDALMRVRTRTYSNKAACMHQGVRARRLSAMSRHARTCARVCARVRARSHEITCHMQSQRTPVARLRTAIAARS